MVHAAPSADRTQGNHAAVPWDPVPPAEQRLNLATRTRFDVSGKMALTGPKNPTIAVFCVLFLAPNLAPHA